MLCKFARQLDLDRFDLIRAARTGLLTACLPCGPALLGTVNAVADAAFISGIVLKVNGYSVEIFLFALLADGKNSIAERAFFVPVSLHTGFA